MYVKPYYFEDPVRRASPSIPSVIPLKLTEKPDRHEVFIYLWKVGKLIASLTLPSRSFDVYSLLYKLWYRFFGIAYVLDSLCLLCTKQPAIDRVSINK